MKSLVDNCYRWKSVASVAFSAMKPNETTPCLPSLCPPLPPSRPFPPCSCSRLGWYTTRERSTDTPPRGRFERDRPSKFPKEFCQRSLIYGPRCLTIFIWQRAGPRLDSFAVYSWVIGILTDSMALGDSQDLWGTIVWISMFF